MSPMTSGPWAVALMAGCLLLLSVCDRGADTAAVPAEVAPGVPTVSPEEGEAALAEEAKETLQARLGALDERLEALDDRAEGPQEDRVDALEERREELADRVRRLGEESAGGGFDPQGIEADLQRLDEDIALVEREVLPDGGDVGADPPPADPT